MGVDDDDDDAQDWEDHTVAVSLEPVKAAIERKDKAYLIVIAGKNAGEMYAVEKPVVIGRGDDATVRILGDAVSRRHAQVIVRNGAICIEDLGSTNGTFVNGAAVRQTTLNDGDKIQVGTTTILKFSYHDKLEEDFQRELYDSALRDGLTKIYNKKHFHERLATEFAYAVRHKTPLSLLMFDIDHFKKLNDNYGHLVGDHVLAVLSKAVQASIRGEDFFARYGGEEFALLCRGLATTQATLCGARVRQTVLTTDYTYKTQPIKVTVSIGVASIPDLEIKEPEGLIAAADAMLYEAKRAGRDRVMVRKPRTG